MYTCTLVFASHRQHLSQRAHVCVSVCEIDKTRETQGGQESRGKAKVLTDSAQPSKAPNVYLANYAYELKHDPVCCGNATKLIMA